MRGEQDSQIELLTTTSPGKRAPATHPIREVKRLADEALAKLDSTFDAMYSSIGRPSIPPERLLKAQLLIALYSVRSERRFCERLDYDLLFRFFLDMNLDDASWDATTFTKNRDRLVEHEVARQFFEEVVRQAKKAGLVSAEHFTVDGTLIEAWASLKSFRKKGEKPEDRPPPDDRGNPTVNFHGEKRSNETHESTTDPEARLAKKGTGKKSKLSYSGHALMFDSERVEIVGVRAGVIVGRLVLFGFSKEIALAVKAMAPWRDGDGKWLWGAETPFEAQAAHCSTDGGARAATEKP